MGFLLCQLQVKLILAIEPEHSIDSWFWYQSQEIQNWWDLETSASDVQGKAQDHQNWQNWIEYMLLFVNVAYSMGDPETSMLVYQKHWLSHRQALWGNHGPVKEFQVGDHKYWSNF